MLRREYEINIQFPNLFKLQKLINLIWVFINIMLNFVTFPTFSKESLNLCWVVNSGRNLENIVRDIFLS